tara:strand:+ start:830 stop:2524 length:1695 start_codon:yes stop_codon:yes gene_type:complete
MTDSPTSTHVDASSRLKREAAFCTSPRSKQQARSGERAFFLDPTSTAELGAHPHFSAQRWFENDLLPRVWVDDAKKRRVVGTLSVRAPMLEAALHEGGFGWIYGSSEPPSEQALKGGGLSRLSNGGFNQLWTGRMTAASRRVLPPELAELVAQGLVVIRAPLGKTRSDNRQNVVGEMSNVLHAALHGYGPLVAGMTWVRTLHETRVEQGLRHVRYRLVSFMEKGDMSVHCRIRKVAEKGFVPFKDALATPSGASYYFGALLRCVHAYSVDRFVFLDATLRNFVDFVSTSSPTRIAVIDIDSTVFRRLSGAPLVPGANEPSHGWKMLWMHNTLVVSCFLKRTLSDLSGSGIGGKGAGDPFMALWWNRVSKAVGATLHELRHGVASDAWFDSSCRLFLLECLRGAEQSFHDVWSFPNMAQPPWSGSDPIAMANAALAYMYHYFVRQPFEEIEEMYVRHALAMHEMRQKRGLSPSVIADTERAYRRACEWYDGVARRTLIAPMLYFHNAVHEPRQANGDSRMLATIMIDYVQTPNSDLQARWLPQVGLARCHSRADLAMFRQHLLKF